MFRKIAQAGVRRSLFILTSTLCPAVLLGAAGPGEQPSRNHCGEFAYVANFANSKTITGFSINSTDGELTQVPGSPFTAPDPPITIATDPAGRFVYAATESGIAAYRIHEKTGALKTVPGSPFKAGTSPRGISIDPSGKFLYVANFGSANISAFKIHEATGALTPVAGAPFAAGQSPYWPLVDATGKFLYVPNEGSSNVSGYAINPQTGVLTPVPHSPFATGDQPNTLTAAPKGGYLYIFQVGGIAGFKINERTGDLTPVPVSPFAASGNAIAADQQSRFLYSVDANANTVSGFSIDSGGGELTPLASSPYPAAGQPGSITVDARGEFAYVTDFGDNEVSAYRINPITGALTAVAGSPFAAGVGPNWIALSQPCATPPPAYSVQQISAPPYHGTPASNYFAVGLNDEAAVVGTAAYTPQPGQTLGYATLSSREHSFVLGAFNGGYNSNALSINERGEIVGHSSVAPPTPVLEPDEAFVYRGGKLVNLDGRTGGASSANGINNIGQIVGSFATSTICLVNCPGGPPKVPLTHAFLYSGGALHDLGTLGGQFSSAAGINNRGQIAGNSTVPGEASHLFLYSDGKMKDLGTNDGHDSVAQQINDRGQIIGSSSFFPSPGVISVAGFLFQENVYHPLPKLLSGAFSLPLGLNNRGEVVGYSDVALPFSNSHAFLYSRGRLLDLNTLVPLTTPLLYVANGINDKGQIVANSADGRAYLLTATEREGER